MVSNTNLTIFPRCCQQRRPFFRTVGKNADCFSAMLSTTQKNYRCCGQQPEKHTGIEIRAVFRVVISNTENDRRCRQQHGTFFHVVGNHAEKFSALWAATRKNCHNAEQYNKILGEYLSTFKETVYLN